MEKKPNWTTLSPYVAFTTGFIHEGGFDVKREHGEFIFYTPKGTLIPVVLKDPPVATEVPSNISPEVQIPMGWGDPPHYSAAIEVLM